MGGDRDGARAIVFYLRVERLRGHVSGHDRHVPLWGSIWTSSLAARLVAVHQNWPHSFDATRTSAPGVLLESSVAINHTDYPFMKTPFGFALFVSARCRPGIEVTLRRCFIAESFPSISIQLLALELLAGFPQLAT